MINPNNFEVIANLTPGAFEFPNIDYSLFPDLNLNKTTLHAAHKIIQNNVDAIYLEDINWEINGDILWQNNKLSQLSNRIIQMINNYKINPDTNLLTKIFIWIQLWGGNSGRGIFVQGNRWENNFNLNQYEIAVNSILFNNFEDGLNQLLNIYGIGTAFATKHLNFWSDGEAPILDSIISKIVIGRNNARQQDYLKYICALDNLIQVLDRLGTSNVTRKKIERNLFNWSNTVNGKLWINIRPSI